jgi:hypothetical protein
VELDATYTVEEGSLDGSFQTCFLCVLIGNSRYMAAVEQRTKFGK